MQGVHIELFKGEVPVLCCPVCKSRDIFPVAGGYIGQVYLCKNCKYRGSFVLEVDDDAVKSEDKKEPEN